MNAKRTAHLTRIALAVPEARLEHNLSQRQLERLSGVSRHTIAKIERGNQVSPTLLIKVGLTLIALDAYAPAAPPTLDGALAELIAVGRKEWAA